ncbi:MAG: thymidine kinase [Lachnospiraceae bacterium]|nr:thymidine kinase [Lachnospiraceae bacterium]
MAKLYFRYGAMGSSKTANALMVDYNYFERGKQALLAKPRLDNRDLETPPHLVQGQDELPMGESAPRRGGYGEGMISSRIGLKKRCFYVEDLVQMTSEEIRRYDCVVVDEAQFCTKEQVEFFVHIVDDLTVPVICYGLRTDFQRNLFPGSMWLLAWADVIEEIKTVCWCGKAATCNARFNEKGEMITEGDQVVLGANDSYIALCRKHHRRKMLRPAP